MKKYDLCDIQWRGTDIIKEYLDKAIGWSIIPGVASLALHPLIIKMISDMNKMAGINSSKSFAEELFGAFMANVVFTPFVSIPIAGVAAAQACVKGTGETYLNAILYAASEANDKFEPIERALKRGLKNIDDIPKYKFVD